MGRTARARSSIMLKPIAVVRNEITEMGRHDWGNVVSELLFRPDLEEALHGLDEFSHIVVLFWMHHSPVWECLAMKTHPQMRQDLPLVGVFATRSPVRPNPIGMSVVKLLARKNNLLKVVGLDALDGSPVVDIKPYLPGDCVAQARFPEWVYKLRQSTLR